MIKKIEGSITPEEREGGAEKIKPGDEEVEKLLKGGTSFAPQDQEHQKENRFSKNSEIVEGLSVEQKEELGKLAQTLLSRQNIVKILLETDPQKHFQVVLDELKLELTKQGASKIEEKALGLYKGNIIELIGRIYHRLSKEQQEFIEGFLSKLVSKK